MLRPFQNKNATGFENVANSSLVGGDQFSPYRGVAVHNVRQALALEDVVDELGAIEQTTLGAPTPIVIGVLDGHRIEAEVTDRVTLWFRPSARMKAWWLQRGPAAEIVLDTPAGTILVTVTALAEEWHKFIPVAEKILAGISFPKLQLGRQLAHIGTYALARLDLGEAVLGSSQWSTRSAGIASPKRQA